MADLIFCGGDVITVNDACWEAEAVAVKDGIICAVGLKNDIIAHHKSPLTKMVDLEGSTMFPGFIEPHTHSDLLTFIGTFDFNFNAFSENLSSDQCWRKINEIVQETTMGKWIVISGFPNISIPGIKLPTSEALDRITSQHPLVILDQTMHGCFFNSKVAEICNISAKTPDPPGGYYERDSEGNITGFARESATHPILHHIMYLQEESSLAKAYAWTVNMYVRYGITTIANATSLQLFHGFQTFVEKVATGINPECPLRVLYYIADYKSNYEDLVTGTTEPGKNNYCSMGVKFFADGSPYVGTMATAEPYLDSDFTRQFGRPIPIYGMLNYSSDGLYKKMLPYHKKGLQIAVHAHGERAIDVGLQVYTRLLSEHPREDHRHRLEHCGLITEAQIKLAYSLGVCLSFYPDHIYFYGKQLRDDILGDERSCRFMPLRTAMEHGHRVSAHSDSPCTPLDPIRTLTTMVTRRVRDGGHINGNETIGVDDAIKAITINAAYHIHNEKYIGSIEAGKIADFTVLSGNPRKMDPSEWKNIQVVKTYKNGKSARILYENDLLQYLE